MTTDEQRPIDGPRQRERPDADAGRRPRPPRRKPAVRRSAPRARSGAPRATRGLAERATSRASSDDGLRDRRTTRQAIGVTASPGSVSSRYVAATIRRPSRTRARRANGSIASEPGAEDAPRRRPPPEPSGSGTPLATSSSSATTSMSSLSAIAATQPPPTSQPRKQNDRRHDDGDERERHAAEHERRSASAPRCWPVRRPRGHHDRQRGRQQVPPRTRNAASARTHVAGRARITEQRAASPAPQLMAPGWPTAGRRSVPAGRAVERRLDRARSPRRSRQVAGAQGRLRQLVVPVRVLDQRRDVAGSGVGHAGRAGRRGRRGRGRRRPRTRRRRGRRRRRRRPPPRPRAGGAAPSPSVGAQTTLRGEATTIRWNSGNADAGRLQVDRLEVDDRIADRDDDEVAADDRAAGLVPERDLLADDRVLVDPRLDLGRARRPSCPPGIDRPVSSRSSGRPSGPRPTRSCSAGCAGPSAGAAGTRPRLAGHPHHHVVGLGREGLLAVWPVGTVHRSSLAEELLRVGHVVPPEHPGLDVELLLRDAQVRAGGRRASADSGLNSVGKTPCVRPDDRIGRVG